MKTEIKLHYFRTEQKIHTNVIINITRANAAPIIYRLVLDILDLVGAFILLFSRFENVVVLKGSTVKNKRIYIVISAYQLINLTLQKSTQNNP